MSASNFASQRDNTQKTHLTWDVFVTPSIPVVTNDFAPGEHERPWPPISSTLIYGLRDAVLVDSFITQEQAPCPGRLDCLDREKSHDYLRYAWARRSLLWSERPFGSFSQSALCCRALRNW